MHRQTLQNFLALAFGTGSQIITQIISVPIFLHFWSLESYAIWLIAVNLSQFTGILDLGMITANQNRFPKLALDGNSREIRERQSSTLTVFILNNFVFGFLYLVFGEIFGKPVPAILFIIFILISGVQSLFGMMEASLRIEGKISLGLNLSNSSRIIEFLSTLIGISIFNENLCMVALTSLLFKTIYFVICAYKLGIGAGNEHGKIFSLSQLKTNYREGTRFYL